MATVVSLDSPQAVLDYLNTITLPAVWDVLDKGGKYTVIDDLGAGVFAVDTYDNEDALETALAASIMHDIPVWAACSEALMRKWEPPDTVESLVIFADNDINFIGQMAANMLAHAMFERGISISVLTPDFSGEDFNDVLIDSLSDV